MATTTGSTKSAARTKAKTTAKGQATKTKTQAKRTASTAKTSTKTSAKRTTTEAGKAAGQAKGGVVAAAEYVRQAVETVVDVPVGAALTTADRVGDINVRFNTAHKRETELKRVRNQLRRELNKVERRGGTAAAAQFSPPSGLATSSSARSSSAGAPPRRRSSATARRPRSASVRSASAFSRWSRDHLARAPGLPSRDSHGEKVSRRDLLAPYREQTTEMVLSLRAPDRSPPLLPDAGGPNGPPASFLGLRRYAHACSNP